MHMERLGAGLVARENLSRRGMLKRVVAGALALRIGRTWAEEAGAGRELFRDPSFRRGFRLCEPAPGKRVVYGEIRGFPGEAPIWDLDQWSSRLPLAPALAPGTVVGMAGGGAVQVWPSGRQVWGNEGKRVALGHAGDAGERFDLELAVNGFAEYLGRARRDGEPWVHLLAEQAIEGAPSMAELRHARFRVAARLMHARLHRTEDYSPSRHAAQFQVFLALQNRNPASSGHGRLLWFGIPLYDDRHRVPPEHKTQDTGGTGMYIFTPKGQTYTEASAHDRDWVVVDRDLAGLLKESLESAWSAGFLTESRDLADYGITSVNLGWEVPGLLDVAMRVRGLSLRAV